MRLRSAVGSDWVRTFGSRKTVPLYGGAAATAATDRDASQSRAGNLAVSARGCSLVAVFAVQRAECTDMARSRCPVLPPSVPQELLGTVRKCAHRRARGGTARESAEGSLCGIVQTLPSMRQMTPRKDAIVGGTVGEATPGTGALQSRGSRDRVSGRRSSRRIESSVETGAPSRQRRTHALSWQRLPVRVPQAGCRWSRIVGG